MIASRKSKRCAYCKAEFSPSRPMQKVCSIDCAKAVAEIKRQKAERKESAQRARETKKRLDELKSLSELTREAQTAFNAFVRARDEGRKCISCNSILVCGGVGGGFDAGHYRSRGAAKHLRFNENNVFGQCKRCNRYLAGNANAMREGVIDRIGLDVVLALERDNTPRKWTREELLSIKAEYMSKLKALEKSRAE